jgi:hypothetical protein
MLDDPKLAMATFYNNPDVQKALNIEPRRYLWDRVHAWSRAKTTTFGAVSIFGCPSGQ